MAALGRTGRTRGLKAHGQVAIGDSGGRPLGAPQGRQLLQRCGIDLGPRRAALRRPDEPLAVDIRRQPLDADQLAAKLFDGVVVKPKAELDPAVGDPALGKQAPDNFLQYPRELHDAVRLPPRQPFSTLSPQWGERAG